MAERASVGIIGGGVVGASIAWHLCQRGISDVVVIERNPLPGWGSTGRAAGGFRHQFAHGADIAFSRLAFERLARFESETGVDPQLRLNGYLFLARSRRRLAELTAIHAVQRRAGLTEAVLLDQPAVGELVPHIVTEDVLGASYCPIDGFLDPLYIMTGYRRAAEGAGARFLFDQEVDEISVSAGRVRSLRGPDIDIAVDWAVVAAGAWSGRFLAQMGQKLDLMPLRRQIAGTHPVAQLPASAPMTIEEDGFHFRKDHLGGGGAMLIYEDPDELPSFNQVFDAEFGARVLPRFVARMRDDIDPVLSPRKCWAGLYAVTPDAHPYIGPLGDPAGVVLTAGFSGHGVMHSPATGQVVAQMIADEEVPSLARPYSPDRFARGEEFSGAGNIY